MLPDDFRLFTVVCCYPICSSFLRENVIGQRCICATARTFQVGLKISKDNFLEMVLLKNKSSGKPKDIWELNSMGQGILV